MRSPALPISLVLCAVLSACGGSSDSSPSGAMPAAPDSPATTNATAVDACFSGSNTGAIFYVGLKMQNAGTVDVKRIEFMPVSAAEPNVMLRTEFFADGSGGFNKFSENLQKHIANGMQPVSTKVFGPPSLGVTESYDYNGYAPTDLSIGESKDYVFSYMTKNDTLPFPPKANQAEFRDTLLSIGPLQTIGKLFPFTCQVEHVDRTLNGLTVNTKTVQWIAPGFGVVREDRFDSNSAQDLSIEVTKVVQEPM